MTRTYGENDGESVGLKVFTWQIKKSVRSYKWMRCKTQAEGKRTLTGNKDGLFGRTFSGRGWRALVSDCDEVPFVDGFVNGGKKVSVDSEKHSSYYLWRWCRGTGSGNFHGRCAGRRGLFTWRDNKLKNGNGQKRSEGNSIPRLKSGTPPQGNKQWGRNCRVSSTISCLRKTHRRIRWPHWGLGRGTLARIEEWTSLEF